MRTFTVFAVALSVLFSAGCSPSAPPADTTSADAKPAVPKQAESLPSDVPVPAGLEGRKDSTQPGSAFFVVQGRLSLTVPDAASAIRKQVEDGGWTAVSEPTPAADGAVETLTFENDVRSLKITLVKVENIVTSVNILTGPK